MRKDLAVGDRPSSVIVGDFNGDSRPDLAVNSFSGISILLNTGGGVFSRPITTPGEVHPMFGPTPGEARVAADFNGDGKLDLAGAFSTTDVSGRLTRTGRLQLGRGDGTFISRDIGPVMNVSAAADFNGDRIPDLATEAFDQESRSTTIEILLGNGQGDFRPVTRIERASGNVRVADFNRDGISDLIAGLPQGTVAVWLGRGDATFRAPIETSDAASGVIADFNKDGMPDVGSGTEVLLGNGDGTFRTLRYVPSRRGFPIPFAAADFDGDGNVDLAGWLSNEGDVNYISVFRGRGDGTLALPVDYGVPQHAAGHGALDFDGDGRPELILSNFRSNSVTLLMPRAQRTANLNRAVSAASGTAIVAPESLATFYGPTGASTASASRAPYPMRLGGIGLDVRDSAGVIRPAPLVYVSAGQINFQVPAGTAQGEATLMLTNSQGSNPIGGMQVDAVAPGLFMASHANSTPAATGVRIGDEGRESPVAVFNCFGPSAAPFSCGPATIRLGGDTVYLNFFGTGFRGASAANVTASINGIRQIVEYAGPHETTGVDRITIRLSFPGSGPIPPPFVTLAIDDVVANTALLQIVR